MQIFAGSDAPKAERLSRSAAMRAKSFVHGTQRRREKEENKKKKNIRREKDSHRATSKISKEKYEDKPP